MQNLTILSLQIAQGYRLHRAKVSEVQRGVMVDKGTPFGLLLNRCPVTHTCLSKQKGSHWLKLKQQG